MLPVAAAQVFTCGDIGHPASELCRRYPQLAAQLAALPEQWWYGGTPDKPNCALRKHFGSHEPKQHVMVGGAGCRGPGCARVLLLVPVWCSWAAVFGAGLASPPLDTYPPARSPVPRPPQARICAFRRWLQERPETTVVAVGHSSYWRVFEEVCRGSKPERMRNCEFRLIHF